MGRWLLSGTLLLGGALGWACFLAFVRVLGGDGSGDLAARLLVHGLGAAPARRVPGAAGSSAPGRSTSRRRAAPGVRALGHQPGGGTRDARPAGPQR